MIDSWQSFIGGAGCGITALILCGYAWDAYEAYKKRKAERAALRYGRHSAGKVREVRSNAQTTAFPVATSSPRFDYQAPRTDTQEMEAVRR